MSHFTETTSDRNARSDRIAANRQRFLEDHIRDVAEMVPCTDGDEEPLTRRGPDVWHCFKCLAIVDVGVAYCAECEAELSSI